MTIIIYIVLSLFILTSCVSFYATVLKKKYVKWISEDQILQFEIQGPYNEQYGLGILKIGNDFKDIKTYLNLGVGTLYLEVYDFADNSLLLGFDVAFVSQTRLHLSVEDNETDKSSFDNLELTINRFDLSVDEIDAKKYLYVQYVNETFGINIDNEIEGTYSRRGSINYNNQRLEIIMDFLDNHTFEIYILESNDLILSGEYTTTKEYIDLVFDFNDFYQSNLDSMRLSIIEPTT